MNGSHLLDDREEDLYQHPPSSLEREPRIRIENILPRESKPTPRILEDHPIIPKYIPKGMFPPTYKKEEIEISDFVRFPERNGLIIRGPRDGNGIHLPDPNQYNPYNRRASHNDEEGYFSYKIEQNNDSEYVEMDNLDDQLIIKPPPNSQYPQFSPENNPTSLINEREKLFVSGGGTYPIRDSNIQMKNGEIATSLPSPSVITSVYPDICARYGGGSPPNDAYNFFPSKWCDLGSLIAKNPVNPISNGNQVPYTAFPFSAQYVSTSTPSGWRYRIYDKINGTYIFLPDNVTGTGGYHTFRDGDTIDNIPGKTGQWVVQLQRQPFYVYQPF